MKPLVKLVIRKNDIPIFIVRVKEHNFASTLNLHFLKPTYFFNLNYSSALEVTLFCIFHLEQILNILLFVWFNFFYKLCSSLLLPIKRKMCIRYILGQRSAVSEKLLQLF